MHAVSVVVTQLPLLGHFLNCDGFVIAADWISSWSCARVQEQLHLATVYAVSKLKTFPIVIWAGWDGKKQTSDPNTAEGPRWFGSTKLSKGLFFFLAAVLLDQFSSAFQS